MPTTPDDRFGVSVDVLSDGPPDGPHVFYDEIVAPITSQAAIDDQGTFALRPVSTPGTPGVVGRYYFVIGDADPAKNGVLWRDHGTGWDAISSGFALDAQTKTSPQTVTATSEATASTIISGHSISYDGSPIEVRVWFPRVHGDFTNHADNTDLIGIVYRSGGTGDPVVLGRSFIGRQAPNGQQAQSNASVSMFDTPPVGAHVYSFRAWVSGPSPFTIEAGAGGTGNYLPGFFRITKGS